MRHAPAALADAPASRALAPLLERVVRRAEPARVELRLVPPSQWHLFLYLPRDLARHDLYLTKAGDSAYEVIKLALDDPAWSPQ